MRAMPAARHKEQRQVVLPPRPPDRAERLARLPPVQVCPGACGFYELAQRVLVPRSRRWKLSWGLGWTRWGKTELDRRLTFVSRHCPRCGLELARCCPSCKALILDARDRNCRQCGQRFIWDVLRARLGNAAGATWHKFATRVAERGDCRVWTLAGDITALAVDAIVVTDDVGGQMSGQVATAIKRAWGPHVENESRALSPEFKLGTAWSTRLDDDSPVKYVIHVAAMKSDKSSDAGVVLDATRDALREAVDLAVRTIAFSAIATGEAGLPIDECARAMGEAVGEYLDAPGVVREIAFVLWGAASAHAFHEVLARQLGTQSSGVPDGKALIDETPSENP